MRRDNRESYGFTLIAIGLLTGFFLGAIIVYWFTSRPIDPVKEGIDKITGLFQAAGDHKVADGTLSLPKESTLMHDKQANRDKHQEQTSESASNILDTILHPDTLEGHAFELEIAEIMTTDSVMPGVLEKPGKNQEETPAGTSDPNRLHDTFKVSRDRFLGIRGFYMPERRPVQADSESSRTLDSLIGSRLPDANQRNVFYIEFWESPLKYSAYKMGKNRIVVYGIDQIDMVGLHEFDNHIYLSYYEYYFKLEYTTDFKLLSPESNLERLRKLEESWP